MNRLLILFLLGILAASACNSAPPPPLDEGIDPRVRTWHDVMEIVIGEQFAVLEEQAGKDNDTMDLIAVGTAARTMARHFALGYGTLEQQDPDDFANRCRRIEQALVDLADLAAQGQHDRIRRHVPQIDAQHCTSCHDTL